MAIYDAPESRHVGNGVETVFGFTFPYLRRADVAVTVNGAAVGWVLVGTAQVSINPAPADGAVVRIYRNTPAQFPAFLFSTGVPMLPRYIDENNRQLLYALQEGLLQFAQTQAEAEAATALATQALQEAAAAAASAAQQAAEIRRTLRVGGSDPEINILPSVAARAGKILGFDSAGNPVGTIPQSGSGTELALILGDTSNPQLGAAVVGRSVVAVSSIAQLRLQQQRTDLMYATAGYYEGSNRGGGLWKWDPLSVVADDACFTIAVPGVSTGRFIRVRTGAHYTAYDCGARASNTGVDNRVRLTALFRGLAGTGGTVSLPDEDCKVDMSQPVIVGADTTVIGRRGWIIPVAELAQPPAASANNPNGTRKCYGATFTSGDPVTGLIYMGGANNIYMGTIRFLGVKIRNSENLSTAAGYVLHGIFCNGGVVVYVDCTINDMPNNGYMTSFYREAHYLRCKGLRNGLRTASGAAGGSKNGISNTSTYTVLNFEYPLEDRSRIVTVQHCEFKENMDEGVQYSSCPLVLIQYNDLQNNGDRAIEGDTAYTQPTRTRPNDIVHVYHNDCRGKSGTTRHSATFGDGYNKDVYLGGNLFGRCVDTVITATCTEFGSFVFTSKNTFELDDVNLVAGCHAMYINAGLIDLQVGGSVTGVHSRSSMTAALLSANNEMPLGGTVRMGNFVSTVTFYRAVVARTSTEVRLDGVRCPTARGYAQIVVRGPGATVEVAGSDAPQNTDGYTTDGIVDLQGLDLHILDRLILRDNLSDVHVATRFPVGIAGTPPSAGRINRIISSGNYWKGYTFGGGAERLTSVVGLALKTIAADLPAAV